MEVLSATALLETTQDSICNFTSGQQIVCLDFHSTSGTDSLCFVNSTIDKFIEAIQLFSEFQNKMHDQDIQETDLIELMRAKMKDIDQKSIEDQNTWWGLLINDPVNAYVL